MDNQAERRATRDVAAAEPDGQQLALMQVLQAASMPVPDGARGPSAIQGGSRKGFLGLFESTNARRHRDVMETIRDVGVETLEANTISATIAGDFFANAMETEATMQEVIVEHRNCALAMAAAPTYVQIARQMMLRDMSAGAQAGVTRVRRKIESR